MLGNKCNFNVRKYPAARIGKYDCVRLPYDLAIKDDPLKRISR